jgi:hypothetical protein
MAAPALLRIPLDEGRFENVGRLLNGKQFMAYVTGGMPDGMKYPMNEEQAQHKKWLAVIHRFDADGNHLDSEARLGALDTEGRDVAGQKAWAQLSEMYDRLTTDGEPVFCDINVKLFSVKIDDITHGLFYEQDEEEPESEWVMLEPCDIMFHPDWDSEEYST